MFSSVLSQLTLYGLAAALVQFLIVGGVTLRVMLTRHPPGSALAWILLTAVLPFAGFFLYLLFGERPIGQIRAVRFRKLLSSWNELASLHLAPAGPLPLALHHQRTLIHLAVHAGRMPLMPGNRLTLLSETDSTFNAIICDIDAATVSVDMEFYIWDEGGWTDKVADALIRARRRGLTVRVLVDSFGSRDFLKSSTRKDFDACGIQVAEAMPMKFFRLFGLQRIDLRLHRKTIIIDNHISYTGSLNMIDPVSYDAAKTVGEWIDAMVRIDGPASLSLRATFMLDWAIQPDGDISDLDPQRVPADIPQTGEASVITVASGPYAETDANLHLVLEAINAARSSLTITTPYFVPNEIIAAALINAAARGVEVELILPEVADSRAVSWAARRYFDDLLDAGVKILFYRGGLLHTKSVAVDGEYAVFGTMNFDNRSLHLNFETMLLIFDGEFMADIKKLHSLYKSKCSPVNVAAWRQRPLSERLKEGACYLISPLL